MLEILVDIGSFIGFVSMLPQMRRTWKNRRTLKDLSLSSYIMGVIAFLLMVSYFYANGVYGAFVINLFSLLYYLATMILILLARQSPSKENLK